MDTTVSTSVLVPGDVLVPMLVSGDAPMPESVPESGGHMPVHVFAEFIPIAKQKSTDIALAYVSIKDDAFTVAIAEFAATVACEKFGKEFGKSTRLFADVANFVSPGLHIICGTRSYDEFVKALAIFACTFINALVSWIKKHSATRQA